MSPRSSALRRTVLATLACALVACEQGPLAPTGNGAPSPGAPSPPDRSGALFSEDFESGTLAAWQDGMDPSLHRVVTDAASARSGARYLAATYPAGSDGGWLTRFLMPGYDSLYVSFYVRFPANWQGGTKLVGLYGSRTDDQWSGFGKAGVCPDGTDFFTAMLLTEPSGNPGPVRFYTYYPAMAREPDGETCWGRYGDNSTPAASYAASLILSRDTWHHVEFSVRLNAPGQADGHQAFWIDGAPWGTWSGLSFRDSAMLRLNSVQLSFSSPGLGRTQELHVDDLLVRLARP
jgi:polysaccharide lyase-like protein